MQVHGANGYLPDQFMSSVVNRRTDAWGGDLTKRARFLLECVHACVKVWGADRVGVRLSPGSGNDGDTVDTQWREQHLEAARQLQHAGVAYVDLVNYQWAYGRPGFDDGFLRDYRTVYRGALFASAGLTREHAERLLQDGLCDACCFGRSFIANPDLPARFLHGHALAKGDEATYYGGAEKGLTDYPRADGSPA